ncbi:hypothetical protein [Microbacterium sp. SORGH_AS_0888]|uniref:hypothetical protein n=1 Tax=Microbacterium sp. SORGH_AS_0888 TaxID=3041791 RepID=UPI0027842857|nr:hypothetical protein [Microbacterium sp. SORGH_AS_0888]MDQ1129965.1 hypothetical protein [Microbacterium sp. SORGH_AS_0888]
MRDRARSRRAWRSRIVLTIAVAVASLGAPAPVLADTPADLITATPASIAVDAPAPGQSRSWDIDVDNLTSDVVTLDLALAGRADVLFGGPTPLHLTIAEKESGTVLVTGSTADLLDRTFDLPDLSGAERYRLVGTVTLPAEAGDAYQAQAGRLDLRFVATRPEPAAPGMLAITGGLLAPALVAAALAAVGLLGGATLVVRSRRKNA